MRIGHAHTNAQLVARGWDPLATPGTFAIRNYQNKGTGLIQALASLGWRPAGWGDLFLIDHDGPDYHRELIRRQRQHGARILVYPHGAWAHLAYDGIWPVNGDVHGYLAMSPGQAAVLLAVGYPLPVLITGWHWCEQLDLEPLDPQGPVLFAPIHPLGNGFMHPLHAAANKKAFEHTLASVEPERITVRLAGTPEQNGIWRARGVTYQQASLENSTVAIDRASVVVSYGTFAYLAVARGKHLVMFGQDHPMGDGESLASWRDAASWREYNEFMRYPIQRFDDLGQREKEVAAWRAVHIGPQMTPEALLAALGAVFTG